MSNWRDLAYEDKSKDVAKPVDSEQDSEDEERGDEEDVELSKKLFKIIEVAKEVEGHGYVDFGVVLSKTGVDLEALSNTTLVKAIQRNEKLSIDKDNKKIKYQPKFSIQSAQDLLETIDKNPDGVFLSDIMDSSSNKEMLEIVQKFIEGGLIIGVKKNRTKEIVVFPRGQKFLTKLSGEFTSVKNRLSLQSSTDVTNEVNRGDCVVVGEDVLRFLKEENYTETLKYARRVNLDNANTNEQDLFTHLSKLPEPYSASSKITNQETKQENTTQYKYRFNDRKMPLSTPLEFDTPEKKTSIYKFGVTNDLRKIWRKVSDKTCISVDNRLVLHRELKKEGLLTQYEQDPIQQNTTKKKTVKRKRRRTNRAYKITNTHMKPLEE